jgi:hypothetical protein
MGLMRCRVRGGRGLNVNCRKGVGRAGLSMSCFRKILSSERSKLVFDVIMPSDLVYPLTVFLSSIHIPPPLNLTLHLLNTHRHPPPLPPFPLLQRKPLQAQHAHTQEAQHLSIRVKHLPPLALRHLDPRLPCRQIDSCSCQRRRLMCQVQTLWTQ